MITIPENMKVNKIKLKIPDMKNYSFAVGRINKYDELKSISKYSNKDKKKMLKWLNNVILYKCIQQGHSEKMLRFNFNYPDCNDWYSLDDINHIISITNKRYLDLGGDN